MNIDNEALETSKIPPNLGFSRPPIESFSPEDRQAIVFLRRLSERAKKAGERRDKIVGCTISGPIYSGNDPDDK